MVTSQWSRDPMAIKRPCGMHPLIMLFLKKVGVIFTKYNNLKVLFLFLFCTFEILNLKDDKKHLGFIFKLTTQNEIKIN